MSKLYKLILLLMLIGLSIIISTAILALQFIHGRRTSQYYEFISNKVKKARASEKSGSSKNYHQYDSGSGHATSSKANTLGSQHHQQQTIKGTSLLHPTDIKLQHQRLAPGTDSNILLGESHLGLALRDIPYETHDTSKYFAPVEINAGSSAEESSSSGGITSSSSSSFSSRFGGNALPPVLKYGAILPAEELDHINKQFNTQENTNDEYIQAEGSNSNDKNDNNNNKAIPPTPIVKGGLKRRGVEFVKLENPTQSFEGSGKIRQVGSSLSNQQSHHQQKQRVTGKIKSAASWVFNSLSSIAIKSSSSRSTSTTRRRKSIPLSSKLNATSLSSSRSNHQYAKEQSVLYHLQKASEYGNHYAQNMIANSLASGILPINNDPLLREHLNITLNVTSDFSGSTSTSSSNKDQLTKAILLWHLSAMEGNIESLMTLGYRHYISATSRSNSMQTSLVHDDDLKQTETEDLSDKTKDRRQRIEDLLFKGHRKGGVSFKENPVRHSPQESHHYGVLGTCESALAYYEEAAHHIMDELESGPLRAKVTPATDIHILAEIKQRGSSSALAVHNKPDELDEAIKFLEMRALRKDDPDVAMAFKLGNMYKLGLRGVKQDLRKALKFYEIGADNNSWESAGEAGKFHLFGMGLEDDERDLNKAYRYFTIGMPGGVSACEERLMQQQQNTHKDKNEDDDYDGDDDEYEEEYKKKVFQCDHNAINGMGLLYIFGLAGKVEPNLKTAVRHFNLAKNMGNTDAMYNLGMLRLGWNNPHYDDLFNNVPGRFGFNLHDSTRFPKPKNKGPSTSGFLEATTLFTGAADMGHLQAKHRLGMIYSKGYDIENAVSVRSDCKQALTIYKDIATNIGPTVTKRMRAAYKQYMVGDYESSLRNYLAAAETGKIEAQLNAAFLLEEGYCLGMDHLQCMKASVRLWRAAAKMGHKEAYLRVGDFYYYGRLREDRDNTSILTQRDLEFGLSPIPWARYVLYPEDLIPKARKGAVSLIRWLLEKRTAKGSIMEGNGKEEAHVNRDLLTKSKHQKNDIIFSAEQMDHFKIAAKYYRTAAVELQSARANFNLGFMHEWGLGLPQDFYLAKRYYDLAAEQSKKAGDGVVANQIALFCMKIHEYFVKQRSAFDEWNSKREEEDQSSLEEPTLDDSVPPSSDVISLPKTRLGILLYHISTWESALILIFTWALNRIVQHRRNNRNVQSL